MMDSRFSVLGLDPLHLLSNELGIDADQNDVYHRLLRSVLELLWGVKNHVPQKMCGDPGGFSKKCALDWYMNEVPPVTSSGTSAWSKITSFLKKGFFEHFSGI